MVFGMRKKELPTAETALPGRDAPTYEIPKLNEVLGTPLKPPFPEGIEIAYLALGCFWGAERVFWKLDGVYSTAVGYMNGITPNPTYDEVCSGKTGHTEAVMVAFDPTVISYADVLKSFYEAHDPTQGMRQGNDVGTQYRSGIYYVNDEQHETAEAVTASYAGSLSDASRGNVTSDLEPAGEFYYAEANHQQYLHKVPNGYCSMTGTGVSCQIPATA